MNGIYINLVNQLVCFIQPKACNACLKCIPFSIPEGLFKISGNLLFSKELPELFKIIQLFFVSIFVMSE
jgi:hypothetical protein